jgi:hypothetical protein
MYGGLTVRRHGNLNQYRHVPSSGGRQLLDQTRMTIVMVLLVFTFADADVPVSGFLAQ